MIALVIAIVLTSFVDPAPHEVTSSNGQFILHVDPISGVHVVRTKDGVGSWSFSRKAALDDFVISDDGKTAAFVAWKYVRVDNLDEPAVEIYRASGRVKSYTYRELVSNPARTSGGAPIGRFWREWRTTYVFTHDNAFHVKTTGLFAYEIDFATGELDSYIMWEGVFVIGYGVLSALLAFVIGWLAMRARRKTELESDRRRIAIAASAPILGGIAQWLYFAGIPFVPASWLGVAIVPWVASVLMTIISAFMLPRLPMRWRLIWTVGVIVLVAVPAVVRALYL